MPNRRNDERRLIPPPKFNGFNRVLIDDKGTMVPEPVALNMTIVPEVGFLRQDGWSLGTTFKLEIFAWFFAKDDWTHFIIQGDHLWRPIQEWDHYGTEDIKERRAKFMQELNGITELKKETLEEAYQKKIGDNKNE